MADQDDLDALRTHYNDRLDVLEQAFKNALSRQHDTHTADLRILRDKHDSLCALLDHTNEKHRAHTHAVRFDSLPP